MRLAQQGKVDATVEQRSNALTLTKIIRLLG